MAMAALVSPTALQCAPSTSSRLSRESSANCNYSSSQCGCGRSSSTLFGSPIVRIQRPSGPIHHRVPVQPSAVKYEYRSSQSSAADFSQATMPSKSSLSLIKDAKIEAQPPQDQKLKLRVDLSGKDTQRAFDTVLRGLAKNAPPVPGFRKAKGGKTSIVPTSVLVNMMGLTRVRKFVIEEIVRTILVEYVEKEGINAKKNLVTDQNADKLDAVFEPGKEFGFDATLELEEAKEAEPKSEEADSEVLAA